MTIKSHNAHWILATEDVHEVAKATCPKQACCSLARHQEATSSTSLKSTILASAEWQTFSLLLQATGRKHELHSRAKGTKGCVSVQDKNFFVPSKCVKKGKAWVPSGSFWTVYKYKTNTSSINKWSLKSSPMTFRIFCHCRPRQWHSWPGEWDISCY